MLALLARGRGSDLCKLLAVTERSTAIATLPFVVTKKSSCVAS
jgi:hypothetical protein